MTWRQRVAPWAGEPQVDAATGQDVEAGSSAPEDLPLVPAPPTPSFFTSPLASPIPELGADMTTDLIEPFVSDLIVPPADGKSRGDGLTVNASQDDIQDERAVASDGGAGTIPSGHRAGGAGLAAFAETAVDVHYR